MQNFLKKAAIPSLDLIIEELRDSFGALMMDKFANYFVQKLLHNASSDQRLKILTHLQKDFVEVSCDEIGTHPMQRFVEMINRDEEREVIFQAIKDNLPHLSFHPKGNYVLILALEIISKENFDNSVELLLDQVEQLSFNKYGICLLNKIMKLTSNDSHKRAIVDILSKNITEIA